MITNQIRGKNINKITLSKERKRDRRLRLSASSLESEDTVTIVLTDQKSGKPLDRVDMPAVFYAQIQSAAKTLGISMQAFFEQAIRESVALKGGIK
jgi:hypothetical protein